MEWKHTEDTKDASSAIIYPATGVDYKIAVNPRAGMLIVFDVFSPATVRAASAMDLVPLHRFSDIAWLIWTKYCNDAHVDPAGLRYILHVVVNNPQSLDTIEAVSHNDPFALPLYPGATYAGSSAGGTALVGTPNGIGAAYLIIDHKKQMGPHRKVQNVRVWGSSPHSGGQVFMLITLDEGGKAVSGTKRPADDSGDEGGSGRPPPGRVGSN